MTVDQSSPITEQTFLKAFALHQAGNLQEAQKLYQAVLQATPNHPNANHNMGVLLVQLQQPAASLPYFSAALDAEPARGQYWLSYIDALFLAGQVEVARQVLALARQNGLQGDDVDALVLRLNAGTHIENQSLVESKADIKELYPANPATASNIKASNSEPAKKNISLAKSAKQSCRTPSSKEMARLVELINAGRLAEAAALAKATTVRFPQYWFGWKALGLVFQKMGSDADALAPMQKAIALAPGDAETYYNLGISLSKLDRSGEAEKSYRRALQINPNFAIAHCNLGKTLNDLGRLAEAADSYRRALQIKPDLADAHNNLGNVFKEQGNLEAAAVSYGQALKIKSDFSMAYSNLLFVHSYHAFLDSREYVSLARNWELACVPAQDRFEARRRSFQRLSLAGRRLKVGYVSGDLRQHAVSYFAEQLFLHHDRSRIELFAYSTNLKQDAVTERLRKLVDHYAQVENMTVPAICDRIDADCIDVLVDLSGHTAHNRLGVFARRAAPVQAHYLGYFASTGLTEMDYWVGDEVLTPPETDIHFSEQVWRLPRVWVSYEGKADAPLSDWQPSQDGSIWLGSFNNLGKLTPATLALWAEVLHALPEGRLLLKTGELADAEVRQRILDAMARHGILPDRIELQDRKVTPGWSAHMAYYDRLDISLDPVGGVGGGTTTCDALWMGVPVISLEGGRMASRMTASMLNAIGRSEWIAHSEREYVDKVVALARNVEHRRVLRSVQREQMANSLLCDAGDLAGNLEDAYFEMFERWQSRQERQLSTNS